MFEVTSYSFENGNFVFRNISSADEIKKLSANSEPVWLNVEGLENQDILRAIADNFAFHELIFEDIRDISNQPKSEFFEDIAFIVLRMLSYSGSEKDIVSEHLSIVLGKNFVITFQEGIEGDVFKGVRERLPKLKESARKYSADYICSLLLHAIIENYSIIVETTSNQIEDLEERIIDKPSKNDILVLHKLRQDLLLVKKSITPLRDIFFRLGNSENEIVTKSSSYYFKDLYNHAVHEIEMIESSRELIMGLQDLYLSSISARLNEVMKVLTVITTIFIPLSFIAGVYGMNFKFMPELEMHYGYPAVMFAMLLIAVVMILIFKKKKWF